MRMRTVLSMLAASLPTTALAQEVSQADNPWFAAAQSVIDQRIALEPNINRARNVILFVGDGMGVGTNYAIRLMAGQAEGGLGDDYVLPYEEFPNSALIKTYSTNGQTPNSAPTASAMNTGVKTKNDLINIADAVAVGDCAARTGNELTTFAQLMSEAGKSVGIVSTARITHATPAAVYAHSVDRDWEDDAEVAEGCDQPDIASQLVEGMSSGVIDLAFGGGRRHFLPESVTDEEGSAGRRADGRNLVEEITGMGGQYAWNTETFSELSGGDNAPVLGLFEPSHMQYEADRTDEPSIAEMTTAAIERLSSNEEGFYLMVESGRIDHANHDGNAARTMEDGMAFADAVAAAVARTDPAETLIIVTADHEHAIAFNGYCGRGSPINGLCYEIDEAGTEHLPEPVMGADDKPVTVVGYLNGPGSVLNEQADGSDVGTRPEVTNEEATDIDYLQQALVPMELETHSGEDVAVYAQGPWAHLFGGTMEQNVIFHVMNQAMNADAQ